MNHKELLLKYISHVAQNEGVTFIKNHFRNDDLFTESEWAELVKLDEEVWQQLNTEATIKE